MRIDLCSLATVWGKKDSILLRLVENALLPFLRIWTDREQSIYITKNTILLSTHLQLCHLPQWRSYDCMPLCNYFYTLSMLPRNTCVFWLFFFLIFKSFFFFFKSFFLEYQENKKKKKSFRCMSSLTQWVKANPKDMVQAHNSFWTHKKWHTVKHTNIYC